MANKYCSITRRSQNQYHTRLTNNRKKETLMNSEKKKSVQRGIVERSSTGMPLQITWVQHVPSTRLAASWDMVEIQVDLTHLYWLRGSKMRIHACCSHWKRDSTFCRETNRECSIASKVNDSVLSSSWKSEITESEKKWLSKTSHKNAKVNGNIKGLRISKRRKASVWIFRSCSSRWCWTKSWIIWKWDERASTMKVRSVAIDHANTVQTRSGLPLSRSRNTMQCRQSSSWCNRRTLRERILM